MRLIDETGYTRYSALEFVNNVYSVGPRKILFWDTCGLFEILRFNYRQEPANTIDAIIAILNWVESDQVYSVASELTLKEWNDNNADVYNKQVADLVLTTRYHHMATDAINKLKGASLQSATLSGQGLEDVLEEIAVRIINKTYFIKTDEAANEAIIRLSNHTAPAFKKGKSEAKDCVIWETMLALSRSIASHPDGPSLLPLKRIFFTVNTDDFANKSVVPYVFQSVLLSEAVTNSFHCSLTFADVEANLV